MQSVQVDVPESLREFIQSRIEAGEYDSVSEYLQVLIRADQKVREALAPYTTGAHLESLIREGLDSGDAGPMTRDDWNSLRRPYQEQQEFSADE